jgi:hypothetical protein
VVVAVLVGLGFAAAVAFTLEPGSHDLLRRSATGLEAPDDGYWSSPVRRLARAGDQDAYDHDLAVALALPQNALAAAAVAVGLPYPAARFSGSLLAAAVLAGCVVAGLAGRARAAGLVGLAFLLTPPVVGHLASDLGEGTALGLSALWAVAALGRRFTFAGLVAAVALSQKALGLSLGVGTLVGALASADRRRDLPRAALGVAAGLASAVVVAVVVFRDAPLAFVLRPYVATDETQSGTKGLAVLVQAVFLGHHGVGRWLVPGFAAAAIVGAFAGPRRPSVAVIAATVAGYAFAGSFPDPWRVLPTLPLLAATFVDTAPARARGTRGPSAGANAARDGTSPWAVAPAVLAAPHAVGGLVAWFGPSTALVLGGATAAVLVTLFLLRRRLGARPAAAFALAGVGAALAAVLTARTVALRTDVRLALARDVAARVPADAPLIGYSFLASAWPGTLYYPPFQSLWEDELARRRPPVLHRLRVAAKDGSVPPGPAGYVVSASVPLGDRFYNRDEVPRPLLLETLRPGP